MNFFKEKPDAQSSAQRAPSKRLKQTMRKPGTPCLWRSDSLSDSTTANSSLRYLADDVVFTKNGGEYMQPWVLMKIADMLAYYNATAPARLTGF